MNKKQFFRMLLIMQELVHEPGIEPYLKDLKNHFNEDQITDVEDYLYHLNDDLLLMNLDQFYNHIKTKQ